MQIRSYSGTSITDLLHEIHRRHGDDALILETHHIRGRVEVEVAVKEALVHPTRTTGSTKSMTSLASRILKRPLSLHEQHSPEILKHHLIEALRVYQGVIPLKQGLPPHNIIMFEGRPGVGKTTTLLKFATLCVLHDHPVHIITLDAAKTSDVSPLKQFAFHTQTTVHVAHTTDDLHKILQTFPPHHRVWIDTPGWGSEGEALSCGFELKNITEYGITRCLVHDVLSEATQSIQLIQNFMAHGGGCTVLTKVDLLSTPEGILQTLIGLSRAYFLGQSQSPNITDPLKDLPLESWATWVCAASS